jgi:large subunit ribosomal protein L3
MTIGVVGRKVGMTRIFTEEGASIPVSVVEVKTTDTDGYQAIQVTTGSRRASRVSKPMAGHFAKAGVESGRGLWEFRVNGDEAAEMEIGREINVSIFEVGQKIDVTGRSIGKGFQGGIKRHNFSSQDMSHGNSISHRSNGSIGMCQTPGRVIKGKKMSGHMGNARTTTQSLELVRVDEERGLLLIKGSIPGAKGGDVIIKPAVKA